MTDHESDFWAEHAIDPDIAKARPYARWTPDNLEPVRKAYHGLDEDQRATIEFWAKQEPGWIITRHAPPSMDRDPIYAEMRPDHPVRTGKRVKHDHERDFRGRHVAERVARHLEKYSHPKGTDGEHGHAKKAKYIFPPSRLVPLAFSHAHANWKIKDPAKLQQVEAKHLAYWHFGRTIDRRKRHTHVHYKMVRDRSQTLARRLDVHRLAWPLFTDAERVFFVIEGCIKADAILTAGEAVFSVPSVSLWNADELPEFATRFLLGKQVIIVPDADWAPNPAVNAHARFCQTYLGQLGVSALVAAPPKEGSAGYRGKGVDDFLHNGGTLAELHAQQRRMPEAALEAWHQAQPGRSDGRARNLRVLTALVRHASPDGEISASLHTIARIMGLPGKNPAMTVSRAVDDLKEARAISVDGDLATQRGKFVKDGERWRYLDQDFWEGSNPTITIREDLRGSDSEAPLG
ncbi:MAG: hypothetical protein ACREV8_00040 [Gammaproteobacteria bacterium]